MRRGVGRGILLAGVIALVGCALAGCKKEAKLDEVPDPAAGTIRWQAAGVRFDVPEAWTVRQYDTQAAIGQPSTEVSITIPDSRAVVQMTIIHLYIRDKTPDELLDLFSIAYSALHREAVWTLMEIDTQAGTAQGKQMDVPQGLTSEGETHRFWLVQLVGRTIQIHETLPLDTTEEVKDGCSRVVMSVGKAADYMVGVEY